MEQASMTSAYMWSFVVMAAFFSSCCINSKYDTF